MEKVFLLYPSYSLNARVAYRKNDFTIIQKPPLGLLYLASSLRNQGIDSIIFDQNVNRIPFDRIIGMILEGAPLFTGIYSDSYLKPFVLNFITLLKGRIPRMKVVIGGPGCFEYEEFHLHKADIVCHGEGDEVVGELVEWCRDKKDPGSIRGISYAANGTIVKTPDRPLIENLDALPFPAFDKIDMHAYYDYHIFGMRRPYFPLIASRGCPNRCIYCSSHNFWNNRFRLRSVRNVVDEIDILTKRYGIRYIAFNDDLFGYSIDWLYEFIDEIGRRKITMKFYCLLNPSSLGNNRRQLLALLKSIGCDIIVIGLQSTDPVVLKNINRHPDHPAQCAELIHLAKELHITTAVHFIYGLPGDTTDVFKRNLSYALRVKPHYALFYMLVNYPGSDIFNSIGSKPATTLPESTIRKWVHFSQTRFFLDPTVLLRNTIHILRKNPRWFFIGLRNVFYLGKSITGAYKK